MFESCLGNPAKRNKEVRKLDTEVLTRSAKRWLDPEYRKKQAERYRAWEQSPERLARRSAQMSAYRKTEKYKQMQKAHGLVRRAIDSGRLTRMPCEKCGVNEAEAHHMDYSKPLEVKWLCKSHHVEQHRSGSQS
jgi:hypothetical protein